MKNTKTVLPKPGQVWKEIDSRFIRYVKIVKVKGDKVQIESKARTTMASLKRFIGGPNGGGKGYSFVGYKEPRGIQVGDTVFSLRNNVWGKEPMKVLEVSNGSARCFSIAYGHGTFVLTDLVISDSVPERKKDLKTLLTLIAKADALHKKLFGN